MATKAYLTKDLDRRWYLLNAENAILGRLATVAADLLRGKGKATYTPNLDSGDYVVIINSSKIKLSNDKKVKGKIYYRHTGYPGGLKQETFEEGMQKHPEKIVFNAVKGMLPKTKQGKLQLSRLRIYPEAEHKHTQEMINVNLKEHK